MSHDPRILICDIETAPVLAHVWGLFKQNVGLNQIQADSYILCWAAKWLGEAPIHYGESRKLTTSKVMLNRLWKLLDEADFVVGHNFGRFDRSKINSAFIKAGMKPPSPYKVIDTLNIAKREFRFTSNKLEFIAKALGCTPKSGHKKFAGHDLWVETLKGNAEAWAEMGDYCRQDVIVTEEVYLALRPWDTTHPNINVMRDTTDEHGEEAMHCPHCGSTHLNKNGKRYTNTGAYTRYRCMDCGASSRSRYTENTLKKRKSLLTST